VSFWDVTLCELADVTDVSKELLLPSSGQKSHMCKNGIEAFKRYIF
jgi:hypothetical protein